jgi:hypothetical protein
MTKSKIAFSFAAFFAVCLLSFANGFAQSSTQKTQVEPSYEVVLQTVIGSNNASTKTDLPPSLSALLKKLKANFSYSNYWLDSTFLQRVANSGSIYFKAFASSEPSINQDAKTPNFLDWGLNGLQSLPNAKGQNSLQFQNFRFGQQIPINVSTSKDESGKTNSSVNYEQLGLTIQKFSLLENVPTVIGSLSTSKPDELMFLILTVTATDE